MSGYQQQGGHYDEGYGHPAGQGDSYYQDEHAAQGGYYDHQDYGDGYYDRGYGHLILDREMLLDATSVKEI
jgi:1,3-beta-glucan synthase